MFLQEYNTEGAASVSLNILQGVAVEGGEETESVDLPLAAVRATCQGLPRSLHSG